MRIPCVQAVRQCLADESDDVVATAAGVLLPLVTQYEAVSSLSHTFGHFHSYLDVFCRSFLIVPLA